MKKFLLLILLAAVIGPPIAWKLDKDRKLNITILDASVRNEARTDHASLVWLLDQLRIRDSSGDPYSVDDYFGFFPERQQQVRVLQQADLVNTELLYIADARGVWHSGIETFEMMRDAQRDRQLHTGFNSQEIDAITGYIRRGGLAVAEAFLFYAGHKGENARGRLEEAFNVRWTGWIGGWFKDLNNIQEVPFWVRSLYERTQQLTWNYRGPGVLLVRPSDGKFVVLAPGIELRTPRPELIISQRRGPLAEGVESRVPLWGWFEIVEARDPSQVHAAISLDVTGAGEQALTENGLSSTFPAVVAQWIDRSTYYLAADLGYAATWLGPAQIKWMLEIRGELSTTTEKQFPGEHAFWRVYVPFVRNLLNERAY